jgi:hypothetical protein
MNLKIHPDKPNVFSFHWTIFALLLVGPIGLIGKANIFTHNVTCPRSQLRLITAARSWESLQQALDFVTHGFGGTSTAFDALGVLAMQRQ